MIASLEDALGLRAIIDHQPAQAGDVPITYADISKARRLLDYKPKTNVELGIEKFAECFKYHRSMDHSRNTVAVP